MQGIGFIDIETVKQDLVLPVDSFSFFQKRFKYQFEQGNDSWEDLYDKEAAFTAEFGKIVSISIGTLHQPKGYSSPMFFVKTFVGRDEKKILQDFAPSVENMTKLCGHNIMEFDGPLLLRRYLINGLPIPLILDNMNRKPWDIPFLDTMAMYSGSAWKYKISQHHLATLLGIPSSKDDMDGSKIAKLYYSDGLEADAELAEQDMAEGLRLIGEYNAKDVVCNARIFARMRGFKDIKDEDIVYLKG
jgi:hypothetical protein